MKLKGAILIGLCLGSSFRALAQTPVPPEITFLADTLRSLDEKALADELENDILSGRVRIAKLGGDANAKTGVQVVDRSVITRHTLGSGNTDNVMTISDLILSQIDDRPGAKRNTGNMNNVLGWALTVRHEYVHMGQYDPKPTPKFENPAYVFTIRTGIGWYDNAKKQLEESLGAAPTQENLERVKELQLLMNAVGDQVNGYLNDMPKRILDGSLKAEDTWDTLDHGKATTLANAQIQNRATLAADRAKFDPLITQFEKRVGNPARTFTGKWRDFTDAEGTINMSQKDNQVIGYYSHNGATGRITGTLKDDRLNGTWSNSRNLSGTFEFALSSDGQRFSGSYVYDGKTYAWKGTRQ